jgi:LPS sulfotransferase NodH
MRALGNLKQGITSSVYHLLSSVGHNEFRKFIVLSRSRTGSNLLISYLNSHPNISAEREIFRFLNDQDYHSLLKCTFSKQPFFIKAKGFKLFYTHPIDDPTSTFQKGSGLWDTLSSMSDLYVIHLKRENILKTMISRKLAGETNIWVAKSTRQLRNEVTVNLSEEELRTEFERTRDWELTGEDLFSNHPRLVVNYEDLANNPDATFQIITEFLGVQYQSPRTKQIKQNPKSMRERLENYDKLKSAFSKTAWASFFDE